MFYCHRCFCVNGIPLCFFYLFSCRIESIKESLSCFSFSCTWLKESANLKNTLHRVVAGSGRLVFLFFVKPILTRFEGTCSVGLDFDNDGRFVHISLHLRVNYRLWNLVLARARNDLLRGGRNEIFADLLTVERSTRLVLAVKHFELIAARAKVWELLLVVG